MAGPTVRLRAASPSAPEPRRLGRYELLQPLATGGMGEVHLACTRGPGGFERLVVVKCALPSHADRVQGMLLAEARLAASLQHANIVQVYDVDTEGDRVFLAMEYLHGHDVRAVIERARERGVRVPLDQAIAIVIAVCAGLHYAHEKRASDGSLLAIVHRDVSPSNVFVTFDGSVKLIDFGIAKATTLPSETELGTLKGKPGYMSPEQCRCERVDRRSDVFCIGILLYELTTGERPFRGETEYLLHKQIIEHGARPPSCCVSDYPPALEPIVLRAMATQRRDRYPTALALQADLVALAAELRLDLSQPGLTSFMAQLFADDLAAWHAAETAGESLFEHVIKRATTTAQTAVELPAITGAVAAATRAPATAAHPDRRSRRWWFALAGATLLGAGAVAVVMNHATPAAAPTPLPSDPATVFSPAPSTASSGSSLASASAAPAPVDHVATEPAPPSTTSPVPTDVAAPPVKPAKSAQPIPKYPAHAKRPSAGTTHAPAPPPSPDALL